MSYHLLTDEEKIERHKLDIKRGIGWHFISKGTEKSLRSQAAIEMVEDGEAYAMQRRGAGKWQWWVVMSPTETAQGFPYTSRRNGG